jgi:hypothetical protein
MIRDLVVDRKMINQRINFDERNLYQILVHEKDLESENRVSYPLEKPEGYNKPRDTFYNSIYENPENWEEVIGERDIYYLSPDADEEVHEFDPEAVYVIGGLVDGSINNLQTRHKAQRLNIKSVKLPLEPFRQKYTSFRPCLNINTVFEIIDLYHKYKDINQAIDDCIPDRFKTGRNKATRKAKRLANMAKKEALEKGTEPVENIEENKDE